MGKLSRGQKVSKRRKEWEEERRIKELSLRSIGLSYDTICWQEGWEPLKNGNHTMRLIAHHCLRVECSSSGQVYVWRGEVLLWNEFALDGNDDFQRVAAMRRAITRAAAEIGRAME